MLQTPFALMFGRSLIFTNFPYFRAFKLSKSVSCPSNTNSSHKILLPGPTLLLPGIRIIASKDLHYYFQGSTFLPPGICIVGSKDLHYCFQRPALLPPGICIIAFKDLHLNFQNLNYSFLDLHQHCKRKEITYIGMSTEILQGNLIILSPSTKVKKSRKQKE